MRYLFVTGAGVLDSETGELHPRHLYAELLLKRPGGIIAGRNLYPLLCPLVNELRGDQGWTASIRAQHQRVRDDRVRGVIYFSHLSYRHKKVQRDGLRYRPGSIKWLVLNLELFCETEDIEGATRALVSLAERRGVSPRYSPGSYGGAMLRKSEAWQPGRRPAPRFISEIAREHLPGNLYQLRAGYKGTPKAMYLDQRSSHHRVAVTVPLPHPMSIRARGRLRAVEAGRFPPWIHAENISMLHHHSGLLNATVECGPLPPSIAHLYPPWAQTPGRRQAWMWTPELRLLDKNVRLLYVSAALTSRHLDPVLWEYAEWALDQLKDGPHPAIKPALLAAYGMLAVRTNQVVRYHAHGRKQPPRSDLVQLPMIERVYRTTVKQVRTPSLQNVAARGVIEAEVRTRSLEMARRLEADGIPAVHIYADGVIAATDQLPFLPPEWRCSAELTDVSAPNPNQIVSRELCRLPGIPNGRRTAYLRRDRDGEAGGSGRASMHLRECEPRPSLLSSGE